MGSKQPQDKVVSGQQHREVGDRGRHKKENKNKTKVISTHAALNPVPLSPSLCNHGRRSVPPNPGHPATPPLEKFLREPSQLCPPLWLQPDQTALLTLLSTLWSPRPGHSAPKTEHSRGRTWSPGSTGGRRWRAGRTPGAACRSPPAGAAPSAAPAPFPKDRGRKRRVIPTPLHGQARGSATDRLVSTFERNRA